VFAFCLANFNLENESPTGDEHLHTTRGLAYWLAEDARLSHGHPALGNALQAIPAAILYGDLFQPLMKSKAFDQANLVAVAKQLYKAHPGAMRASMVLGRRVNSIFLIGLMCFLFVWVQKRSSNVGGLFAALLVGTQATTLANVRVVTTDFPLLCAGLVLVCLALSCFQDQRKRALLYVTLAAGACASVKYSALVLLCIVVCGALFSALFAPFIKAQRYEGGLLKRVVRVAKDIALVALGTVMIVCAVYRFEDSFMSYADVVKKAQPVSGHNNRYRKKLLKTFIPKMPQDLAIPLPYSYLAGIATTRAHAKLGHKTYFNGKVYRQGRKAYFPTLLVVKTPLPVLLLWLSPLWLCALWLWQRRVKKDDAREPSLAQETYFLWAFALVFLAFIINASINIGFRHAIVVVGLLSLSAAFCVHAGFKHRVLKAASLLCAIFVLLSSLVHHPDPIGAFSILVGRGGGTKISLLSDDWGQDTKRFADFVKDNNYFPISYEAASLGGKFDAQANFDEVTFINCKSKVMPGYAAVHKSRLERKRGKCYRFTESAEFVASFNDHIELYKIKTP